MSVHGHVQYCTVDDVIDGSVESSPVTGPGLLSHTPLFPGMCAVMPSLQ